MKTKLKLAIITLTLALIACGQDVTLEACTRKCSARGGTDNEVQVCIQECLK